MPIVALGLSGHCNGYRATVAVIYNRPWTVQPGNQEWVTTIEYINVLGRIIPPLVIFEVVMYQAAWYEDDIILHNWLVRVNSPIQIALQFTDIFIGLRISQ